jgi:acetylglutamate/LysW-gamma-L-alpha-aminoadipate kinase
VTNILKIGGGRGIDGAAALRDLAERFQQGERWVLVHGASAAADALAEQVGYPAQTLVTSGGHSSRYTDARTLEIYCAAAATVNQQLVSQLTSLGLRAVGLAGPNVIRARRKTAIRALVNGRQVMVRDDYTGTITGVDGQLLALLLDAGFLPVVAPVALGDGEPSVRLGERLNIDGDLAAANIAQALNAERLVILSNVPGLLRDVNDPASLISSFNLTELSHYKPFAHGRMKKKLLAAQTAQTHRVILSDARIDQPLSAALNGAGTHINSPSSSGSFSHASGEKAESARDVTVVGASHDSPLQLDTDERIEEGVSW